MNGFFSEGRYVGQETIDEYKIDLSYLPKLSDIKYLPLSVSNDKVRSFIIGKWEVFKNNGLFTEKDTIEFGGDNTILNSSIKKWKNYNGLDWEFEDYKYDNYTTFNRFQINGVSTMEIIYIDKNLLYARGHANQDIIFIKEESLALFKEFKDIVYYLYEKEKYWVNLNRSFNEKHLNGDIKESLVAIWAGLTPFLTYIFSPSDKLNDIRVWGLLLLVGFVLALILVIYYKLRWAGILKQYISLYHDTDTAVLLKAKLSHKF